MKNLKLALMVMAISSNLVFIQAINDAEYIEAVATQYETYQTAVTPSRPIEVPTAQEIESLCARTVIDEQKLLKILNEKPGNCSALKIAYATILQSELERKIDSLNKNTGCDFSKEDEKFYKYIKLIILDALRECTKNLE